MHGILKKAISIVLLFVFFYNISGYYFAFNLWQMNIKDFMQSCFREKKTEELILITVSAEEKTKIEWESNDEFRLNGKMYDVASRKLEKNILYFYCYSDSQEDQLFDSLNKHIKNHIDNSTTGKNSKSKLKHPASDFYALSGPVKLECYNYGKNKKTKNAFWDQNILIEFPSPPPRLS
jgi:hypothetical protein